MPSKSKRQYVKNNSAKVMASAFKGVVGGPMPKFVEPSMATLVEAAPKADGWVHEIKFDGYRLQAHKNFDKLNFYTRRGYDWTDRFKVLWQPILRLKADLLVLDGEVIVEAPDGTSDFGALESDLAKGGSRRLVYYAFDLLYIDGWDLRKCALVDRKRALASLIGGTDGPMRYSEHLEERGDKVFQRACDLKLEGVVSKKADARYNSGRTSNWTKITCRKRDTFVVAGLAFKGKKFDGIYLARREDGELTYAGKVERGFTDQSVADLVARVSKFRTRTQPLTEKIKKPKAAWLKPKFYADVEYRALTGDGKLRHPSFKGLREDY